MPRILVLWPGANISSRHTINTSFELTATSFSGTFVEGTGATGALLIGYQLL